MSMEAQFYEARRRQNVIERRHSLRTQKEIDNQILRQNDYQYLSIPVHFVRQNDRKDSCTCRPIRPMSLMKTDQSLFQRDRDIYPRPVPIRRHRQRAILHHRFTSTDYLQQW